MNSEHRKFQRSADIPVCGFTELTNSGFSKPARTEETWRSSTPHRQESLHDELGTSLAAEDMLRARCRCLGALSRADSRLGRQQTTAPSADAGQFGLGCSEFRVLSSELWVPVWTQSRNSQLATRKALARAVRLGNPAAQKMHGMNCPSILKRSSICANAYVSYSPS
jgi:hypothetical protein